ncbi:exopolyphosphatase / guanosine-5'-triphosphate,3'-diphosphate pyrophosphatase [Corynebacterium pollutisoli]|uniref:Exopolyphosphatase / guanosine-5'-triphosphate,3'-diphosphate pyrophosphatase n=1 Tax=Corynebacterium pollutisoli TaxID=1610489 RepID=A0A1X7K469_9CORY|nr:Ppx/GppA phosphatase family protein [Corynebacterium pollutisoli]SMG35679.1 exopolyphosphatase / guanosine-5'-triphosphate,3'-diphosphate pyrophosphatase [Corynebacterium pollutisoli]
MTRVAAVDCGTNSIRLLICDIVGEATREITRTMEIVRLGQGVDATGELDPVAIERTRAALSRFVEIMEFEEVKAVRMVATSATRDASNRDDFFRMTAELLGRITPGAQAEVISGEEEAALSFRGAITDLNPSDDPFCVIDLGGGSTEFIVGTADGEILGAHSAQMGCVRVTERIMRSDPPTDTETEIAMEYIGERLADVVKIVPVDKARTFVGVAGTFTTLSALAQGLETYDPREIHGSVLNFSALRVLTAEIRRQSAETRGLNPVVHPGRADVLGGGSAVVDGIMDMIAAQTSVDSFVISEKDILDGIVAGLGDRLRA